LERNWKLLKGARRCLHVKRLDVSRIPRRTLELVLKAMETDQYDLPSA
jgi:hypothetical protein